MENESLIQYRALHDLVIDEQCYQLATLMNTVKRIRDYTAGMHLHEIADLLERCERQLGLAHSGLKDYQESYTPPEEFIPF